MLINKDLANKSTATQYGDVKFNAKGESNDLTKEQQKHIGKVKGFTYKEDKPKEKPKETKETKTKPKDKKETKETSKGKQSK